MQVEGPDRFTIKINERAFEILDAKGAGKFSGRATFKLPKLYVVTAGGPPIYVGITRQSMRSRLRLGWNATGEGEYHGYRWRHYHREATLDLWYHLDPTCTPIDLDIETILAELVYLIANRANGPSIRPKSTFIPHPRNTARSPARSGHATGLPISRPDHRTARPWFGHD